MKKDILAALDKGDIEGARDILLAQTIEEVGDSNSWDSPNYIQKVKTLQEVIPLDQSRSKLLTYFGLETLRDRYFLRSTDLKLVEGPQQFFARVAAGITLADQFDREEVEVTPDIVAKATELYDVISKLWFMPATPVLTNTATDRGNLVSCLRTGSLVSTRDRGFIPIEDIRVGEYVLTHKGRFKPVVAKRSKESSDIWQLKVDKRRTVTHITGNHLVLTDSGWKRVDMLDMAQDKIRVDSLLEIEERTKLLDLTEACPYNFKINTEGEIVRTNVRPYDRKDRFSKDSVTTLQLPAFVEVNDDIAWALGLWFAEGSHTVRNNNEFSGIRITLGKHEHHLADRFITVFSKYFNCSGNKHAYEVHRNGKPNNWLTVNIHSSLLGCFFASEFGVGCKSKEIPSWVLHLPKSQREAFYKGFIQGDGSDQKTYITVGLANPKLLGTIYQLGLSLGKNVSVRLDTKAGKLSTVPKVCTFVEYKSLVLGQYEEIVELFKTDIQDTVWDIQVKDDESFSVHGFIVHNCFLSYMGDSITDIYKTIEECAHLGAGGGGLGVYMGDIRGHGAPIRKTLKSSGTIPFMKVLDSNTLAISQGSTRRASAAIYLDISHPDCEEYINIRKPTGGDENRKCLNIHHGVNITDDFMQAVNKKESFNIICPHTKEVVKTIDARTLWKGILKSRIETGEPFIHYIDTSNRNTLQSHSEKGLEIKQSNLCFSGDTIVAVADGRNGVTIKQLAEESKGRKKFPVYCAREAKIKRRGIRGGGVQEAFWTNEVKRAVAFKTGVKKLVQVFLDDNSHFKCTKDHLIALKDGDYIEAGNLKSGDSLQPFNTYTRTHKETPYRHIGSATNGHTKQHRLIWEYHNGSIPKGYHIDHINNDIRDDSITNLQMLSATEHRKKTSKEISGTNNWVYRMDSSSRERWLATKNKLAKGEANPNYNGITNEELIAIGKELYAKHGRISQNMLRQYRKDTGVRIPYSFSEMRFGGSWSNYKSMVIGNHKVVKVLELEEEQEVYDLTVEDNHNFYIITSTQDDKYLNCSGVLVHNCSEIILPTNKDRTAICVLGSINIEQCPLDQLEYVSAIATEALDNVLTLFLKTANPRDYKRAIYSASKERSIGLGLMGWHGYLMREKIPFEGVQSVALAKIISEKIQNAARAKSIELAKTKGECEDNPGNRNSYLTAIAPTANISIIAGNCTPCIEPIAGNAYLQKTLSGSFLVKNVYLENLLKEKGQNTAKVWKSIIKNAGSVQQLDFLSEEEKKLFKTAYELDQRFIIKQAAARQKHICQAQSLNLFFGRTENGEIDGMYLHQVHYEAWESGVKTLYYLRSDSVLSAKINTEECVACQ